VAYVHSDEIKIIALG